MFHCSLQKVIPIPGHRLQQDLENDHFSKIALANDCNFLSTSAPVLCQRITQSTIVKDISVQRVTLCVLQAIMILNFNLVMYHHQASD